MKKFNLLLALVCFCGSAFAATVQVKVSSPTPGSTVSSPVTINATSISSRRTTGWRVYVDSVLAWSGGATTTISPKLSMSAGTHKVTVRAWVSTGNNGSTSFTINVASATPTVSVSISPTSASVTGGKTEQFSGTVSGTTNTSITWQVNGITGGNSTVGTISTSGLYTAPVVGSNTSVTVTARSYYDSTKYANASVNVSASGGNHLYVSTTGSDSNSCTSSSPCRTISRASQVAVPGTTVHVAPGTYTGNFATSKSGTSSARITYVSDTKWGARLVGTGTGVLWALNASYVDVVGFDISGPNNFGIYAGWSGTTPGYIHFINNRVHDITNSAGCTSTGGGAIDTGSGGPGNDWFIGNVVSNIGASMIGKCNTIQGIYIANANAIVKNNIVSGVAAFGIQQWHGATASTIVNNTVFNCRGGILLGDGDGGALPGGSSNNFVANNISVHNTAYGIVEGGTMGSNNTYTDNLVWSNPQNYSGKGPTSGTITADPMFANYKADGSGNYHLSSGSPAINAGTSTNAPSTDFDGNARSGVPDIGAFEYPL